MSDTPRTDDQIGHGPSTMDVIDIKFVRRLERELAKAKVQVTELQDKVDYYKESVIPANEL